MARPATAWARGPGERTDYDGPGCSIDPCVLVDESGEPIPSEDDEILGNQYAADSYVTAGYVGGWAF